MICNNIFISISLKMSFFDKGSQVKNFVVKKNLPLIEEGNDYSGRSNEKVSPSFT
jgi:hypothetical protein